jgi:hypothetical protein
MPPKSKPFSDLGHERQRILTKTVSDILERHCPSLDEAHLLLNKVFSRCQSVLPGLSGISGKCSQFVASLGDLRASVAEAFSLSRITSPSVSVADLDRARALSKGAVKKRRELRDLGASVGGTSSSFLPLLPRFHRPLLDFANPYFDSCM